jgi:hypothetical protein
MTRQAYLLIWIALFAIAMGFLESAVVVYLRAIYYPSGFAFPLRNLDPGIVTTEVLREASTMIMLITIALISVKAAMTRFAVFIYAFAIWDIFYYVFLWLLLDWPPSFFTWDILFLIPVTWVGPVLAPVINSLTMIVLAILIIRFKTKNELFRLKGTEWVFLVLGSVFFIFAYTQPYIHYLMEQYSITDILRTDHPKEFMDYTAHFVPSGFNWWLFSLGEALSLITVVHIFRRMSGNH